MYDRISLLDDDGNKFHDELRITMLNTFSGIMRTNHNPTAPPPPTDSVSACQKATYLTDWAM